MRGEEREGENHSEMSRQSDSEPYNDPTFDNSMPDLIANSNSKISQPETESNSQPLSATLYMKKESKLNS